MRVITDYFNAGTTIKCRNNYFNAGNLINFFASQKKKGGRNTLNSKNEKNSSNARKESPENKR